jgi:hypothetical protein
VPNPKDTVLPEDTALRHLTLLADELRRAGLRTVIEPDRRPFPGVRVSAPAASAVIMAGQRCYWRQVRRDLVLVGLLSEPEFVAETVKAWLTGRKKGLR